MSRAKDKRARNLRDDEDLTEYAKKVVEEVRNPLEKIRIDIKAKNEKQKELLNSLKNNTVTFCEGPAGTGKTYVTMSYALKELSLGKYKRIILAKSVTTLEDEALGFLKGTVAEKLMPVMYSFTGNVEKIIGKSLSNQLIESGLIEWMPLAYLRGVSIDNALIIIDETQNITIKNIRTILSRIGENSRMVLLGDVKQKDVVGKRKTALEFILQYFNEMDGIGTVSFSKNDIVRHPIVQLFETKFDELDDAGLLLDI